MTEKKYNFLLKQWAIFEAKNVDFLFTLNGVNDDEEIRETFLGCLSYLFENTSNFDDELIYNFAVAIYNTYEIISSKVTHYPNNVNYFTRFIPERNFSLDSYEDGNDYYTIPSTSGLYFIGQITYNSETNEKLYWVKIGLAAKSLKQRMRDYRCCCPTFDIFGFKTNITENIYALEAKYQHNLMRYAFNKCNHNNEWFLVDEVFYNKMKKLNFDFFN